MAELASEEQSELTLESLPTRSFLILLTLILLADTSRGTPQPNFGRMRPPRLPLDEVSRIPIVVGDCCGVLQTNRLLACVVETMAEGRCNPTSTLYAPPPVWRDSPLSHSFSPGCVETISSHDWLLPTCKCAS